MKMKDKIIDYHPVKGFITFNDLITDLKVVLDNYLYLEEVIIGILENFQFDYETIVSLFSYDIASSLKNMIDTLQDRL